MQSRHSLLSLTSSLLKSKCPTTFARVVKRTSGETIIEGACWNGALAGSTRNAGPPVHKIYCSVHVLPTIFLVQASSPLVDTQLVSPGPSNWKRKRKRAHQASH
ncbi:hypothetical protein BaRGS_00035406 [Batillaria attramentaria]|uniref:Secreted protein n=1 Tax=Batillaria attramentaria TaxID=370345 RepID=A0ABD0JEX6_9CAEN